jgi:[ribosomal protein S18]-alanine N-acetyltransferase
MARAASSPAVCAISVLRASASDLDAIMAIEEASFAAPWPRDAVRDEITACAWSTVVKAVLDRAVAGFAMYWTVADERHLQNLAVSPAFRRRGVGDALVRHVVAEARRTDAAIVLLEVRESNEAAQRLYAAHGFVPLDRRRGYYQDNGEDAIVMGLPLIEGVL